MPRGRAEGLTCVKGDFALMKKMLKLVRDCIIEGCIAYYDTYVRL